MRYVRGGHFLCLSRIFWGDNEKLEAEIPLLPPGASDPRLSPLPTTELPLNNHSVVNQFSISKWLNFIELFKKSD